MSFVGAFSIGIFFMVSCGGVDEKREQKTSKKRENICSPADTEILREASQILTIDLLELDQSFRRELRSAVFLLNTHLIRSSDEALTQIATNIDRLVEKIGIRGINCKLKPENQSTFDSKLAMPRLEATQKQASLMRVFTQSMKEQIEDTIEKGLQKIPEIALRDNISVRQAKEFFAQKIIETYSL